ncbi:hypothetical protein SAMN05660826_01630 [Caldanaerovirga acetigignens]|uniref:Uncharacterized protein n=1 Tax=Caldanaerovirga acetigignens TaxID=447595 RepID=A0A1M7KNC9_9FIRM|nr:hypothetical protein [Caldanaerovirga acetigignens]SHM66937.1 hypothetical protein SAMN05660826_01630 [Caldanaerovirga acetigignens]
MKVGKTLVILLVILAVAFFFIKGRQNDNRQAADRKGPIIVEQEPSNNGKNNDVEKEENKEHNDEKDAPVASEKLTGEAVYIGQIDVNSIEVKEGEIYEAYRLSPQIKEGFEELNLEENDRIEFTFHFDENGQKVITGIKKKP